MRCACKVTKVVVLLIKPIVFLFFEVLVAILSSDLRACLHGFFCFHALRDSKQKKTTPLDRGPPLHVNRVLLPNDRYFDTMVNFRDPPTSPGWQLTTSVLFSSILESPIIHVVCPRNFANKILRTMDNFFNFQWSRDSGIVKNTNHLHH